MKIKDINKLGLMPKTVDRAEIDLTCLIVDDAFNRPNTNNYREDAIKRLVALKEPFHSECNIAYDLAKTLLKVECPYCHNSMSLDGGSGNGSVETLHFRCNKCKSAVKITIPSEGINVYPQYYA